MKKINDFMTIPANAIHYIDHRSKAITNVLLHSLLPVVFAGGADNLLQNLLILGLQHVAEWLQLATLLKACTMGLKIGLVVYFIRFSYKMGNRFTTSMHRQLSRRPNRGVSLIPLTYSHAYLAHYGAGQYSQA
ncbi:hypothetical protein [Rurimicrobium arvi]|uniref:Uncharacterized protein n=1 Tax=Rurimicrobium arvi TaxID=2049916 RepID=A0ABP8MEH9_9BACT